VATCTNRLVVSAAVIIGLLATVTYQSLAASAAPRLVTGGEPRDEASALYALTVHYKTIADLMRARANHEIRTRATRCAAARPVLSGKAELARRRLIDAELPYYRYLQLSSSGYAGLAEQARARVGISSSPAINSLVTLIGETAGALYRLSRDRLDVCGLLSKAARTRWKFTRHAGPRRASACRSYTGGPKLSRNSRRQTHCAVASARADIRSSACSCHISQ
jgi:hypothetical protein